MDSVESASALVSRYSSSPPSIRTKQIHFQYSNRSEVKTNSNYQPPSGLGDPSQTPNHILLVSVLNTRVPVTLENIHQIFKPYGEVIKIITFLKDSVFKALVQLATVEQAINAKLLLEGKDMFQGCCHLRIGFSKLTDLKVTQNGPRSRDFTIPDPSLPLGGFGVFGPGGGSGYGSGGGYLFPPSGGLGTGFFDSKTPYSPQPQYAYETGKDTVLLVNNLTPDKVTPDNLFKLFGVYGDVLRVKILFKKRDTALIQFANPQGAHTAQHNLNRVFLHSKDITVSQSKYSEISMPRPDSEEAVAGLTKDFTNSPIHRFKSGVAKGINPPSQVLHVSNLGESANEEELRKLFGEEQSGTPVVQFFRNDRKMAYVKMDSMHDAILALMRLHNYKLGDRYMRVSFSQKEPSAVTGSDSTESTNTGGEE